METSISVAESRKALQWSAILAGAFVFFALLVVLVALGSAIGLTFVPVESGTLPSRGQLAGGAVLGLAGIVVAFFLAGYVAGLPAGRGQRAEAVLHGLLAWAVIAAISGVAVGGRVSLVAGSLFAGRSASTLLDEMNPRVVSDVKVLNGKVVSRVVTDRVPEGILGAITELGDRFHEVAKDPALRRTAGELRSIAAVSSWAWVLALLAGAAAAAAGATRAGSGRGLAFRGEWGRARRRVRPPSPADATHS